MNTILKCIKIIFLGECYKIKKYHTKKKYNTSDIRNISFQVNVIYYYGILLLVITISAKQKA